MLVSVSTALIRIHEAGLVHRDLHPGNIFIYYEDHETNYHGYQAQVGDLGLCIPADEKLSSKIYGNLPYVAPEVLQGKQQTKESDIYSFGIIMSVFASWQAAFEGLNNDCYLAYYICTDLRPEIPNETPEFWIHGS
ncbi:11568_t:CDS:1 [Racocetra fulgida]|uniref:11568_t:CDS:1 n=1 Tax=Racocetra fulgida TaxID=60492 RepID=A0A9N9FSX4_9GLOM|nr:11568_t:CDS:1 [Racocetra fulgida]